MKIDYQKLRFFPDDRIPEDKTHESERFCDHQQRKRIERNERIGLECVQSFICNMTCASSLEELYYSSEEISLVESICTCNETEWTVPKWAKAGDIVFFMHAKTARSIITKLRTELLSNREKYNKQDFDRMMTAINADLVTYSLYGGKIFAIGRVSGGPEFIDTDDDYMGLMHWNSHHYALIDNVIQLPNPIDISCFNSFITVSRGGAITPVWGNDFDRLKKIIAVQNSLPWYVTEATSRPIPLRKINRDNWIAVANDYRRSFILEEQFRTFYVDYLLHSIGDKKKFYAECRCSKPGMNPSFIDNVFLFNGKYLAVEVKLSVPAEPNIKAQVSKYCYNTTTILDSMGITITDNDMHSGKVLVIDTEEMYMYDAPSNTITTIFDLDSLKSGQNLEDVKSAIRKALGIFIPRV